VDPTPTPTLTPTPQPTVPPDPCAADSARNGTITGALSTPTTRYISRANQNAPDIIVVTSTLTNTGTGCFGPPYAAVERLVDGAWTQVKQPAGVGTPGMYYTVRPGTTTEAGWFFHADEPAGELRLRVRLTPAVSSAATSPGIVDAPFLWPGVAAPPAG
jgi:hypothetical protein